MVTLANFFFNFFAIDVTLDLVESMRAVGLQLILAALCPEIVIVLPNEDASVA